jgi:hypothetical protein
MVTVSTRVVHFPERRTPLKNGKPIGKIVNRGIPVLDPQTGKIKTFYPDDPGGVGTQIVGEGKACPYCAMASGLKLWKK